MILKCEGCKPHEFQDEKYGSKVRVHTCMVKPDMFRCTVCEKERGK